jgi:hypothetical protein
MRFLFFKDIFCFGISIRSVNKQTDLNNGMEASLPFVMGVRSCLLTKENQRV